jgi:hypothetical protein
MPDHMRRRLLEAALLDTKIWCYNPKDDPRINISDQHWIDLFSGSEAVTGDDAETFLHSFQLDIQKYQWDTEGVADVMNQYIKMADFNPINHMEDLASDFGQHLQTPKATRQISAATKFSNFAKPAAEIYIWDKWVRKAVGTRAGQGMNAFARFHTACAEAFATAMTDERFLLATSTLIEWIDEKGGPMADRERVPTGFIQRRLFDKLMLMEGKCLGAIA